MALVKTLAQTKETKLRPVRMVASFGRSPTMEGTAKGLFCSMGLAPLKHRALASLRFGQRRRQFRTTVECIGALAPLDLDVLALQKSCRLCENSAKRLRGRIFFHVSHGNEPRSESKCSQLAFFRRLFYLPLRGASFHTVSKISARLGELKDFSGLACAKDTCESSVHFRPQGPPPGTTCAPGRLTARPAISGRRPCGTPKRRRTLSLCPALSLPLGRASRKHLSPTFPMGLFSCIGLAAWWRDIVGIR